MKLIPLNVMNNIIGYHNGNLCLIVILIQLVYVDYISSVKHQQPHDFPFLVFG